MLNLVDETIRRLHEGIANKFEQRLREACEAWHVNPDDHEEVKARCQIKQGTRDAYELIIDNHLVMMFTNWSMNDLDINNLNAKISVSFKCSEVFIPNKNDFKLVYQNNYFIFVRRLKTLT